MRKRAAEATARLKRLCDAIESGIADISDPMLKDRVTRLRAIRDLRRDELCEVASSETVDTAEAG